MEEDARIKECLFFGTPAELRRWFKANHQRQTEAWIGFHKRDSGRPSITWPEAVDEALSVGWIDGLRQLLGVESYRIRFTPRRAGSIWSRVNLGRYQALLADGRVTAAGRRANDAGKERTGRYYDVGAGPSAAAPRAPLTKTNCERSRAGIVNASPLARMRGNGSRNNRFPIADQPLGGCCRRSSRRPRNGASIA